jgi:hypothetical protein
MDFVKTKAPTIAIMAAAALAAAALLGGKGVFVRIAGTVAAMGGAVYVAGKVA